MTAKPKKTSRILDSVHEIARCLYEAGFISKRRMEDYDALCGRPAYRRYGSRSRLSRDPHS
jgi:hypothetical protein